VSEPISAKVPEELYQRVEHFRDDGETRSAAVERLIRAGLDRDTRTRQTLRVACLITGASIVGAWLFLNTAAIATIGTAAVLVGLLWSSIPLFVDVYHALLPILTADVTDSHTES